MSLRIIVAVIAVPILAALFAWSTAWYVRSTMSQSPEVRRRAWLVEILMSLGVFTLCLATTPTTNRERHAYLFVLGLIAATWLFRGARLLLHKRKHA
jgi:hypothetical protein